MLLKHGGSLNAAVKRWGIAREHWLDLSTGINPHGWPVPKIPAAIWQRLPEADDGLAALVRQQLQLPQAAGCELLAGSQAAIMNLPRLRPRCRVGVPRIGYQEHAWQWQQAGHTIVWLDNALFSAEAAEETTWLEQLDVLIWINPNNPTGQRVPTQRLLQWLQCLQQRNGWLIVDEAFIDATPEHSLCPQADATGLLILRSLGKFYGLAGVRAGAIVGDPAILAALPSLLGPWTLSGPSRYLMARALSDQRWQQQMRQLLAKDSQHLRQLLQQHGHSVLGGCALFQTIHCPQPQHLADALAAQGILVRQFGQQQLVRFGLPANSSDWQRLAKALADYSAN